MSRARRAKPAPCGVAPSSSLATSACLGFALLLAQQAASAAPKWNSGLELGACGRGTTGLEQPGFCGAAHGNLLFSGESGRGLRVGPALRLSTARFDDVRLGAGASLLVPVLRSFPLVLEAGPALRNFRTPGAFASAFFGVRTYNHYGDYEMAAGLSLMLERSFTTDSPMALWLMARLDGSWLVLPFLAAYNGLK